MCTYLGNIWAQILFVFVLGKNLCPNIICACAWTTYHYLTFTGVLHLYQGGNWTLGLVIKTPSKSSINGHQFQIAVLFRDLPYTTSSVRSASLCMKGLRVGYTWHWTDLSYRFESVWSMGDQTIQSSPSWKWFKRRALHFSFVWKHSTKVLQLFEDCIYCTVWEKGKLYLTCLYGMEHHTRYHQQGIINQPQPTYCK